MNFINSLNQKEAPREEVPLFPDFVTQKKSIL